MTHTRRVLDGAKLREIRQDHLGLSQAEMGKTLGVTRKTVARWEGGAFQPSYAMLLRLAQTLDTDLDTFSTRVPVEDAA